MGCDSGAGLRRVGEEVLALFHTETSASLATKYNAADAKLLIARWENSPAGCIAFDPFDEESWSCTSSTSLPGSADGGSGLN
jgi:hypothetical protein